MPYEKERRQKKGGQHVTGHTVPAMPSLRVLQIHTYLRCEKVNPRSGGKSRVSLMLTRYLLEAGHEVALYSWPERIWGDAVPFAAGPTRQTLAFPTLALPSLRNVPGDYWRLRTTPFPVRPGRSHWADLLFLEGLKDAIRKFRPHILHCHQTDSDIPALLRALGKPIPAILTHHSGRSGPQLDAYDRIIFLGRSMQEEVCRQSGYAPEKSSVVYYPILDEFQRGNVIPAQERRGLISVGVLTEAKGVDLLLEAYRRSRMLRQHPLTICGAGEDEEKFREFVRRHRLPVVFKGRLTPLEVKGILSSARLLVNPSRMEGFSVALLEALACGTPVVGWAPQVRELEEWWGRRVGFPFDARTQTAAELAQILEGALHDSLLRTGERKELARLARKSFSMERYGAETLKNYRVLLDSI
jgi:glycosyltransferase involved in cell wall biosynthesis